MVYKALNTFIDGQLYICSLVFLIGGHSSREQFLPNIITILYVYETDLFAFIIKMPTLHRLACFRDDIIFFIYLYQRWVYRIDYTRINEYGQSADVSQTSENVKIDSQPASDSDHNSRGPISTDKDVPNGKAVDRVQGSVSISDVD